jgi:sugar lactone lactonase YvrE
MWNYRVMTVDPDGHAETVVAVPGRPSGLGWLPDGRLLVISMTDRTLYRLDLGGLAAVADLTALTGGNTNDMVVVADGRAYIGNIGFVQGETPVTTGLVLVTPDGGARVVAEGLLCPNGSVITPDGGTLIVAETVGQVLTAFSIAKDGSLYDRRTWADLGEAIPDGICLDAEGAVWVSATRAGEFLRVREGGEVTRRIVVPDKMAVACMLGGEDRQTLFLLTSRGDRADREQGKSTGWIETIRVQVPGAGLPYRCEYAADSNTAAEACGVLRVRSLHYETRRGGVSHARRPPDEGRTARCQHMRPRASTHPRHSPEPSSTCRYVAAAVAGCCSACAADGANSGAGRFGRRLNQSHDG